VQRFTVTPDHTQWHTTLCMTPLDEGSVRRGEFYLTRHNTQKRETSMAPSGMEPAITASELPQTHASDRAASRICYCIVVTWLIRVVCVFFGGGELITFVCTLLHGCYILLFIELLLTSSQGWHAYLMIDWCNVDCSLGKVHPVTRYCAEAWSRAAQCPEARELWTVITHKTFRNFWML